MLAAEPHVFEEQLDVAGAGRGPSSAGRGRWSRRGMSLSTRNSDTWRGRAAGSVTADTMKKSENCPSLMKCFLPLSMPAVAALPGARPDRRGVGAGAGLGDRDRAGALAAHRGQQPALLLRGVALEQRLVDVAERAPDQDVLGVAELLLDQHRVDRGQAAAAVFGGNVHRVEAERASTSRRSRAPWPGRAARSPRSRLRAGSARFRRSGGPYRPASIVPRRDQTAWRLPDDG